ncbi:cilia- and flagella-associated protein 61-like isoform X1 [Hydractinia symbiolongicarpus]|uniref:cilia- and flagella-associated protein 61-like isoform X1 n=1 Tax=Hydractinia symbiolongicarpus TaxID=13093 RepID=UPI00254E18F4|nr:cilia- and flagella-associated protein 61-like isoform X1 [Hydractinia symbiolongicarpus]
MSRSSNNLSELAISARRTESLDASEISQLVTNQTYDLFGRVHIAHIIEKANLAVTLTDDTNAVVGHAAFYDQPNWNVSNDRHWMCWLKENFNITTCDPVNSLFMHYYVSKEEYSEGVINEIIRTIFYAVPLLHFVILIAPVSLNIDKSISTVFEPIERTSDYNADHQAYVCHRHNHCPVLHIREARIEDHDDLMPIFDKHNNHLTKIYGEYFLAELIEAQDNDNKCIVGDVNGTAVGFMSVSTNVNTSILKENFELEVFNYFLKKIERKKEVIHEKKEEPSRTSLTPSNQEESLDTETSHELTTPTPTNRLRSPMSRNRASPIKSARSVKLSSSHLEERPSSSKKKEQEPEVQYITEVFDVESVFCIQLYCIDEKYEARSIDFLPVIFDLFKDKDFAIITVPHTVPEFPLIQAFQRVSPKSNSVLPQELYIFNRNGLRRSFQVRTCRTGDFDSIKSLTETICGHADILKDVKQYNDYRRDEDGVRIYAYVAEVIGQIVGVCIFRQEKDIEYIRSHYNIEDFVYYRLHESNEHVHLHHFVLNPIFQHFSKYFLKEIFYLSKASCMYYLLYTQSNEKKNTKPHSLITCLNDMVPVSARRQIIYPVEDLMGNSPVEQVLYHKEPYALYHMNRKLTLEPKVVVNIRIVVVGASDTALSALQTLVFCPHLNFNNLILISETEAFEIDGAFDNLKNAFIPQSFDFNSKQKALKSLKTWVNFVKGKLTRIDRKNKCLTIDGSHKVPYDQLLLCTGEQYHATIPTGADVEQLVTTSEAVQIKRRQPPEVFKPENVFVLNDLQQCFQVQEWLKNSFKTDKIVVYGNSIEAYTCINGLLTQGVDGCCIHHVHSPSVLPSCFNEPHVDEIVKQELEKAGVQSYYGYTLARWNNDSKNEEILKVATFTSDTKPLSLECQAFFCFDKKSVEYNAFKAINDSCLVFDGKLVIDSKFHTNDENIQAAGPLTKYARRYHSNNWTHANFNSREIGTKLAESVLELFDPTLDGVIETNDGGLIPKYTEPKVISCQLPGGYNYLHIWKPCVITALEQLRAQPDYGQDLVTGKMAGDDGLGYFRIHVNQHKAVQDITCLSKQPINATNLLCLYGMHERYLNNMVQRYTEGLITDFYSYFNESWCLAIYHDRFKDFRNEIREILSTPEGSEVLSVEERVRRMVREDVSLCAEEKSHLMDAFVGSGCKMAMEERLNCFLDYNKYHLPMFARPAMM